MDRKSDQQSLAEITIKAVILGVLLSAILGSANAYLGLFAGMTVSASIPAAVVSMGVLRMFRTSTILENNIVQTAASAGESLAAGVIFTLPALIILDFWKEFDFLWVTVIAGFGGILGVMFTIPLRRSLIVQAKLKFPEGIATFTSALSDLSLGIAITFAIAIHNIPEGIAVSVPIYFATGNRRKAFWLSFLSGLAEPLGAVVGYILFLTFFSDTVFGFLFAAVAGIMVFVSLDELLPAAREYGEHHVAIYGLIAGMAVMAMSLQLFL